MLSGTTTHQDPQQNRLPNGNRSHSDRPGAGLKSKRIYGHCIFWALYFGLHVYLLYDTLSLLPPGTAAWQLLVALAAVFAMYGLPAYIHNILLIPWLLHKRKYLLYGIALVALVTAGAFFASWVNGLMYSSFPQLDFSGAQKEAGPVNMIFPCALFIVVFALGRFMADSMQSRTQLEELQRERLVSELRSLKSQINPHFLFNALNTIYGMARRKDDDTPDAILKLSEILRYVLYESNTDFIDLETEISHITSYIEFARLRTDSATRIEYLVSGDLAGKRIAPLILLPFIENSFKHGLQRHIADPWLRIEVKIENNVLFFFCANSNTNKDRSEERPGGGRIGLLNVQRRLELIYRNKHRLTIADAETEFVVNLEVELD